MKFWNLTPADHLELLVKKLAPVDQDVYRRLRNSKLTTPSLGSVYVAYCIEDGMPVELERVEVDHFKVDAKVGVCLTLYSHTQNSTLDVGFEPVRLFDLPVFVHIPLTPKLSWEAPCSNPRQPKMSFSLYSKTQHKRGVYEEDAVYFEPLEEFEHDLKRATTA
jgi:hypothetical protein